MRAGTTASGKHSDRSHTVGFIGLGLAVVLTFVVLWAAFFRGADPEVSQKREGTAASALAPDPGGTPANNKEPASAASQPAAPRSAARHSPKAPPTKPPASVGNGTSKELNKFDRLRTSVNDSSGALAAGTLPPTRAKTQYQAIAGAYAAASSGVGSLTSDTRPAQLHSAVVQAASAYEVWITQLQSTSWPPEVQPYVDSYLALATTKGRALFDDALHARTLDDLQSAQAINATFELSHALEQMRAAMGVSQ